MSEPDSEDPGPLRLTKFVRDALLRMNEGYQTSTYYEGKNFREQRDYEITDGKLHFRSRGKTSWADSRFDDTHVADGAATHRFLRKFLYDLNTDGVQEAADALRAEQPKTPPQREKPAPDEASDKEASGDADSEPSGLSSKQIVAVISTVAAAIAAAPHIKKSWKTKGKPKVEEWRARRAAKRHSRDKKTPVEQVVETQSPPEIHG